MRIPCRSMIDAKSSKRPREPVGLRLAFGDGVAAVASLMFLR